MAKHFHSSLQQAEKAEYSDFRLKGSKNVRDMLKENGRQLQGE
jgi:hypothetical protein